MCTDVHCLVYMWICAWCFSRLCMEMPCSAAAEKERNVWRGRTCSRRHPLLGHGIEQQAGVHSAAGGLETDVDEGDPGAAAAAPVEHLLENPSPVFQVEAALEEEQLGIGAKWKAAVTTQRGLIPTKSCFSSEGLPMELLLAGVMSPPTAFRLYRLESSIPLSALGSQTVAYLCKGP